MFPLLFCFVAFFPRLVLHLIRRFSLGRYLRTLLGALDQMGKKLGIQIGRQVLSGRLTAWGLVSSFSSLLFPDFFAVPLPCLLPLLRLFAYLTDCVASLRWVQSPATNGPSRSGGGSRHISPIASGNSTGEGGSASRSASFLQMPSQRSPAASGFMQNTSENGRSVTTPSPPPFVPSQQPNNNRMVRSTGSMPSAHLQRSSTSPTVQISPGSAGSFHPFRSWSTFHLSLLFCRCWSAAAS